jgi:hypothetical protein
MTQAPLETSAELADCLAEGLTNSRDLAAQHISRQPLRHVARKRFSRLGSLHHNLNP